MKRTLLWLFVVLAVMIASPALTSAQPPPSGQAPMAGQPNPEPMMGGKHDPKVMGQMPEMRGEMLKAMGEIMMKHGKAMQDEGKTP